MALIFIIIAGILFGPPLLLFLVGFSRRRDNPQSAKVFYILAVVYLIIGGGICASILTNGIG